MRQLGTRDSGLGALGRGSGLQPRLAGCDERGGKKHLCLDVLHCCIGAERDTALICIERQVPASAFAEATAKTSSKPWRRRAGGRIASLDFARDSPEYGRRALRGRVWSAGRQLRELIWCPESSREAFDAGLRDRVRDPAYACPALCPEA